MSDHKTIYNEAASNYELLVSREDYQGNLLRAIRGVLLLAASMWWKPEPAPAG